MGKHHDQHGIIKLLKERGERITQPRVQVIEYLCDHDTPVSVKNLEKALPKINMVTLYRILEYLVEHDVVKELTHDPKEKYFEIADPYHDHHHHMICRRCNKIRDIDCKVEVPIVRDFIPEMHVVTIYGHCKKCT